MQKRVKELKMSQPIRLKQRYTTNFHIRPMIPEYLISIFRIVLVLLILVGMIVVLLAINHVTHNDDTISQSDTDRLKRDLTDNQKVITRQSVFHKFLARDKTRRMPKRH